MQSKYARIVNFEETILNPFLLKPAKVGKTLGFMFDWFIIILYDVCMINYAESHA